tara:strand:+ start:22 stop:918 length:897 start_codon:yes stop_codon:yes gene_type:complete
MSEAILAVLSSSVTQFVPTGANSLIETGDDPASNVLHGAVRLLAPDAVDPLIDLGFNKDWRNQRIYNEPFPTDPVKNLSRMGRKQEWDTNPSEAWASDVAKYINDMTGGNEVRAGAVTFQPEYLTYVLQSLLGGTYKTATRGIDAIAQNMHNDWLEKNYPGEGLSRPLEIKNVPVLRRFYAESPRPDAMRRYYYDRASEVMRVDAELRGQDNLGMTEEADAQFLEEYPLANAVEAVKEVRKLKKEIRKMVKEMKAEGYSSGEIIAEKRRMELDVTEMQDEAVRQMMEDERAKAEAESN